MLRSRCRKFGNIGVGVGHESDILPPTPQPWFCCQCDGKQASTQNCNYPTRWKPGYSQSPDPGSTSWYSGQFISRNAWFTWNQRLKDATAPRTRLGEYEENAASRRSRIPVRDASGSTARFIVDSIVSRLCISCLCFRRLRRPSISCKFNSKS